ncbi:hypothetical protein BJ875DRAFT_479468 [Amylocarpus encephaloides]|uniref:SnoaL-like domain-containing protein n=1 Tax=Amylocarpus encephaloides TaxID=45428 RepID=A0A9P7YTX1_9HELO|nr:hypothetical protein BJ875DRAFT_479468 [Amylocarpus encephaloides]
MPLPIQKRSNEEVREWILEFQKGTDSLDTSTLGLFYTEDATLNYANNETLVGLKSIVNFFEPIFKLLVSMKHTIKDFGVIGEIIYLTCTISYTVANDPENRVIKLPAAAAFRLLGEEEQEETFRKGKVGKEDGEWACLRAFEVYLDPGPLYGRLGEVEKLLQGEGKGA